MQQVVDQGVDRNQSIGDRQAARAWYGRLLQLTAEADNERPEMAAARAFLAN
jgi:hypothetical protein